MAENPQYWWSHSFRSSYLFCSGALVFSSHPLSLLFPRPPLHRLRARYVRVVYISDVQIVNEVMLEDINNILNAGDVPNLYAPEDMDSIMSTCRSGAHCHAKKKRIPKALIKLLIAYKPDMLIRTHTCLDSCAI